MNLVLDTSALFAIANHEPERRKAIDTIAAASDRIVSSVTALEMAIVLRRRLGEQSSSIYERLLRSLAVRVVAFDDAHLAAAIHGDRAYGQGTSPRSIPTLNFGDTAAYALAKVSGYTLLYKGDDFGVTDLNLLRLDAEP